MTEQEVIKEITSEHKWHIGYCSSTYATNIKQRYEAGFLGKKAINKLFNHFGYTIKQETQWERK